MILKVAHHGSSDQSAELFRFLSAEISVFSVGQNPYGHPTDSAISLARNFSHNLVRTDELGSIAFSFENQSWEISAAGKLTR